MRSLIARTLLIAAVFIAASANAADKEKNKLPDEVKAILDKADRLEVYSLDPKPLKDKTDGFHGFKPLDKTEVKEADTRKDLVKALTKGVEENTSGPAFCFNPRHGIHAVKDKKSVDLVICFECAQIFIYLDDGNKLSGVVYVEKSPQPAFDKVLKAAEVPLPKGSE